MSKKFYTLRYDLVFRNTFYRYPKVMKIWIHNILKILKEDSDITEFNIRNCELVSDRLYIKNKTIDMLIDTDKMVINVEVNNNNYPQYIKNRNFMYLVNTLSHDVHIKHNYNNIKQHIQLNFNFEGKSKKRISKYEYLEIENNDKLISFAKIYAINVDKYLDEWYNIDNKEEYYKKYKDILILGLDEQELKEMESDEEYMQTIKNQVIELNEDPEFFQLFTDEEDRQMIFNSALEEATETAQKLGIEIGEKRGEKRGERRGEKRGKKQGIIETAINMLNDGVDKNIISKYTGLSIKEIEKVII